jgi:MoaA/NifB/PqqE/SkfB family radical SAM enzyme
MKMATPPEAARQPATAGTIAISKVFLHVTRACNLSCDYCYLSAGEPAPDEMQTEDYTELWPELVALRPRKVVFTGGEPLLRPDILDLMRGLREADPDHRVVRCLNTNGCLMTPPLAQKLVGLADEVRVSIDGLSEHNDALRGDGSFQAALRALECLYAVGFEPKVMITITPVGLPDLTELLCLLVERNVTRVSINPLRPVGRGRRYRGWQPESEELTVAMREAWRRCSRGRRVSFDLEPEPRPNCVAGSFVNVMPNGDVFPCHVLTAREFYCGNVRGQSLAEICSHSNLLGELQGLDFRSRARRDEGLLALVRTCGCAGTP